MVPPRARTRVTTTSTPTPRPETSLTASAVLNPGRATHDLLEMEMKALELLSRRQRRIARFVLDLEIQSGAIGMCHTQLITDHLHRHRKIQRRVDRVGRNMYELMATGEMLVREPRMLGPEHDSHSSSARLPPELGGALARVDRRPGQTPQPRARTNDVGAIGNRIGECGDHLRARKQIIGARSACGCRCAREILWCDEDEISEAHRLHRARTRADIARVRRLG
jgi:hypothetical protein